MDVVVVCGGEQAYVYVFACGVVGLRVKGGALSGDRVGEVLSFSRKSFFG